MKEIASLEYAGIISRILRVSRKEILPDRNALLIFDGNTVGLFPERNPESSLTIPTGETAKTWASVMRILNRAVNFSMGRDGTIVGIGGGVVTDVSAFAASIYMRGCKLILIPTTLLAMVDAAIGGKTGINFAGFKNLVGTFAAASEVRINLDLLDSLPEKEYLSGLSEVVKHAMLEPDGTTLYDFLVKERKKILAREKDVLEELVSMAVKVKIEYVKADVEENGKRACLNLGHTFAHALEAATSYGLCNHGEAVIWGIRKALKLGIRIGVTDKDWADGISHIISDYGFNELTPSVSPDEIVSAMMHDKKKRKGHIRFVLMESAGKPVIREVPEKDYNHVLESRN